MEKIGMIQTFEIRGSVVKCSELLQALHLHHSVWLTYDKPKAPTVEKIFITKVRVRICEPQLELLQCPLTSPRIDLILSLLI